MSRTDRRSWEGFDMAETAKKTAEKPVASETVKRIEEAKGAKKRAETKPLPPLDFTQIKVRATTKDDLLAHRRTKGKRDPEQVATDNLTRQAYDKWLEAGSPTDWLDSSGFHIRLPEGQFETFEKRVRNSGQHYGLAVRFGQRIDSDGYAEVVMIVKDRPKKDSEGESDEAEEASGSEA